MRVAVAANSFLSLSDVLLLEIGSVVLVGRLRFKWTMKD
jgi:hypothetical protein